MKKITSLVGMLMVLTAGAALAQPGINLAWNDCLGQGGVIDKTQTCTNSGTIANNMFTSFLVPTDIPLTGAADGILDVQVDSPTLPTWWTQGLTRFNGTAGAATCPGWFDAAPNGPVPFGPNVVNNPGGHPNRVRIRMVVSVATGEEQPVLADGTEYHSHIIGLRYGLGTFNNPGCLTPACIVANDLLLQQPGTLPATRLVGPSTSNHVTWRGGGAVPCPAATPAKKATWGSIKALYR